MQTVDPYNYDKDRYTALEAITEAQKIALAPLLFQAAINLRNSGILAYIDENMPQGIEADSVIKKNFLSPYATQLLLDVGLSMHILYHKENKFFLGKVGHFILHDQMTIVNMDFSQDVCYEGAFYLEEAFKTEKPSGLKVFGDWPTIYPALSQLPEQAKKSWFAYDHFYSDSAFNAAFKEIAKLNPKHIYDVGGNTGKWAFCCLKNDPNLEVTIIDLPQQIKLAEKNIEEANLTNKIHGFGTDLLTADTLPTEADIWWMSQFLDCFSEEQIVTILTLVSKHIKPGAKLCILEVLWDRQPLEAGALAINASSLYFTCMANGNSRFYHSEVLQRCIEKAGFRINQMIDQLGISHTLLICEKV